MSDETYTIGHHGNDQPGHSCGCHEQEASAPELDARSIPHAIRHGAILGALGQLQSGGSMVLIAPHNPLPLLDQIEQAWPDGFERRYLQQGEGDGAWKVLVTRRALKQR